MVTSAFHPFPGLPTELRLQIWQLAFCPFSKADNRRRYQGGAHYFSSPPASTRHFQDPLLSTVLNIEHFEDHGACKSAYRWDAGLFRACRESRNVARSLPKNPLSGFRTKRFCLLA